MQSRAAGSCNRGPRGHAIAGRAYYGPDVSTESAFDGIALIVAVIAAAVLAVGGHVPSAPPARPTAAAPASTAAPARTATVAAHRSERATLTKPRIVWDPIPFGATRKAQMRAYAQRHYGLDTYKLIDPHVIVVHFTETPDFQSTFNTFAPDTPDPELHELPNTCAHYVIDRDGTIHQLVSIKIMCRHTVGLNWTAIGIEHVGYSDRQVLDDRRQMDASLALVHWLRCRLHIEVRNVIGHNESLSSPYHHENVPALRTQTHGDFNHADMQVYRRRLRALGGCPASS
jgi:N-acetylmuramoyl-L-alanine amidase